MIPFNKPTHTGNEDQYVLAAMREGKMSGDGHFSALCHQWFKKNLCSENVFLTPSGTNALETAAVLSEIGVGDEVIMPSFTFPSTANAFVLRGADIVFIDIRPDTMNMDETLVEKAITKKTKAIVPVHYAGVGCEMETIKKIASEKNLVVIEDAAQGMMSRYKKKPLGTLGHFGTISFHDTKNYTSGGEGGLLILNDQKYIEGAEIIRHKGTNWEQFKAGKVDKYSWVDWGSSCLMSELQAAYLWGQLEKVEEIHQDRLKSWHYYDQNLSELSEDGWIERPVIPDSCSFNGHIFYIKVRDINERTALIKHLRENDIAAAFHYVPLHSSRAGKRFGKFNGEDRFTTHESNRLIRLPLWYGMGQRLLDNVIQSITSFFHS